MFRYEFIKWVSGILTIAVFGDVLVCFKQTQFLLVVWLLKKFVYEVNNNGPNIEPWALKGIWCNL